MSLHPFRRWRSFAPAALSLAALLLAGCVDDDLGEQVATETGEPTTTAAAPTAPETAAMPAGTYRITITRGDLADVTFGAQVPSEAIEETIVENLGTYTWTIGGGTWRFVQVADPPPTVPSAAGTYTVVGDRVTFAFPEGISFDPDDLLSETPPPPPLETFTWRVDADGALHLRPTGETDALAAAIMASHPLERIADGAAAA